MAEAPKMPDTIDFDVRMHGIPAGYKLVPIEPTADMIGAVTKNYRPHPNGTGWSAHIARIWQQMVVAAPVGLTPKGGSDADR